MFPHTPSQTIGPFFHDALIRKRDAVMVQDGTKGLHIDLEGQVFDGSNKPVTDAVVEIWQADASGIYNHSADPRMDQGDAKFNGYGRCATDAQGKYAFKTVKPGAVPRTEGLTQAPHITVMVFARGMLRPVATRVYFEDENTNTTDTVLNSVPESRRTTLLAQVDPMAMKRLYLFDIWLQGQDETVFFVI